MNLPRRLQSKLRAPLPPQAISPNPTRPGFSAITPAFVIERLNECFGVDGWSAQYEVIEREPMIVVRCDLRVPRYRIHRQAFGGNHNEDRGDAFKGACTDALTKAASHLGIGLDVYKGQSASIIAGTDGRPKLQLGQYDVVDGVVNKCKVLSGSTLFMLVNQTEVRAIHRQTVNQLKNSHGKRVELRCRLDQVRQRKVLTALNVLAIGAA